MPLRLWDQGQESNGSALGYSVPLRLWDQGQDSSGSALQKHLPPWKHMQNRKLTFWITSKIRLVDEKSTSQIYEKHLGTTQKCHPFLARGRC